MDINGMKTRWKIHIESFDGKTDYWATHVHVLHNIPFSNALNTATTFPKSK